MEEIWKDVITKDTDYTGYYQVSTHGRVRSLDRITCDGHKRVGKIMKQRVVRGYWYVCLTKDGQHKYYRVHKLVAEAFIPNPENKPQVGHKDEKNFNTSDECNNNVENLEWVTPKENNNQPMRKTRGSASKIGEKSAWHGKHRSEETKEKQRAKMLGQNKDGIHVIIDNIEFISITACSEYCGIHVSTLARYLNEKCKMPEELKSRGLRFKEKYL